MRVERRWGDRGFGAYPQTRETCGAAPPARAPSPRSIRPTRSHILVRPVRSICYNNHREVNFDGGDVRI